jgi:hypothetical protein
MGQKNQTVINLPKHDEYGKNGGKCQLILE